MASTKELQEQIVGNMHRWKKVEDASVASTGKIMEETDNELIRLVMEIIQRDSQTHHQVQEFIASTLEHRPVGITPEEMSKVWSGIEHHIEIEKKAMDMAKENLEALKGKKMVVQEYLLNYLLEDEEKHNKMLETLDKIKDGMYPYG